MSAAVLRVERDRRAGCVYLARSRRTGAVRGVYRAEEADMDVGDKWAVVCEDHGTLLGVSTRAAAMASDTDDFCDECREATDLFAMLAVIAHNDTMMAACSARGDHAGAEDARLRRQRHMIELAAWVHDGRAP